MRMWMIPTKLLCNKHLLGEHGEIHKHRHNFVKRHNMGGRLSAPSQIDPINMQKRHDELASEMLLRKMNHKSPYEQPDVSYLFNNNPYRYTVIIDIEFNIRDLADRCPECRKRIMTSEYRYLIEESA